MVAKHTYFEVLDVADFVVYKQVEREKNTYGYDGRNRYWKT